MRLSAPRRFFGRYLNPVVLLGLVFSLFLLNASLPTKALAQQNYFTPNSIAQPRTNPDVPSNQHTFIQSVVIELMASGICLLSGIDVLNPTKGCLGIDPLTQKIGYTQPTSSTPQLGGAIGSMSGLIGALYTPPASVGTYTTYLAQNFGISKSFAQENNGFNSLSGLLGLFTITRNVVYLGMVIIFVLVGLGIMLRVKIDPRTVMSIQNQIPKIVVSLILVTFSYAIVGLLVDAMWVSTYVGINIVSEASPNCGNGDGNEIPFSQVATQNILTNPYAYVRDLFSDAGCFGAFDGVGGLAKDVGFTIGDVVARTVMSALGLDPEYGDCGIGFRIPIIGVKVGSGSLGNCVEILFFGIIKYIVGILGFLIALIAIMVSLFRLWFQLLKAYVYVLLDVIVGPIYIVMGLLPGSSLNFTRWLRHVVAHLALFPATVILFVTLRIIAASYPANNPGENAFVPPLIGNPNIADNIGTLIAFGGILMGPELLNAIRNGLKTPGSPYAKALGGGVGAGVALPVGVGKGVGGTMASSREMIVRGTGQGGQVQYGPRGTGRAIAGRLFSR